MNVSSFRSWAGAVLVVIYLIPAIFIAQEEIRHTGGGWINLRGIGTAIATFPSQAVFGTLLKKAGVKVDYHRLGAVDYGQIVFHILVTALLVYLIGWGGERLFRWLLAR